MLVKINAMEHGNVLGLLISEGILGVFHYRTLAVHLQVSAASPKH